MSVRSVRGALAPPPAHAVELFCVLLMLYVLPVLVVDLPAGVDFPNHLARMGVLSEGGTHSYYDVEWELYPSLAMDLVVPFLAHTMSVEWATKIFYLASQLLVATGAVAIELVHKRRFEFAGFIALGTLYSVPFAWGFVNFTFGCGIALWGVALHLMYRRHAWWLRLGVHSALVAALFVSHFFALAIYGLAVGLIELHQWWPVRWDLPRLVVAGTWLVAPVLVLMVILSFTGGAVTAEHTDWLMTWKPIFLLMSFNGYSWTLSAALCAGAILVLYLMVRHRALRPDPLGWWLAVAFFAAFSIMPFRLFGTAYVDVRLVVVAVLILPAFFSLAAIGRRLRLTLAGSGLALLLVNLGFVAYAQLSYDRSYDQMRTSLRHVALKSRVLIGGSGAAINPPPVLLDYPMYNAPVLAVSERDAFVPQLFTAAGRQPLVARSDVAHLDIPYGSPVPVDRLQRIATVELRPEDGRVIADWHHDYDYLVVVGEERRDLMPEILERLDGGDRFTLYRIRTSRTGNVPYAE